MGTFEDMLELARWLTEDQIVNIIHWRCHHDCEMQLQAKVKNPLT